MFHLLNLSNHLLTVTQKSVELTVDHNVSSLVFPHFLRGATERLAVFVVQDRLQGFDLWIVVLGTAFRLLEFVLRVKSFADFEFVSLAGG